MRRARLDRAQVVEAAAALADEQGLAAATLSAVARRLGVRPPSLYKHVASLEELHAEVAVRALDELRAELVDAIAGRSGPDAVRASARAFRDYARRHPGRYAATGSITPHKRGPEDQLAIAADRLLDVLRHALRAWDLTDAERIDAIRTLRALSHGFVELERAGGFQLSHPVDRSSDFAVDAIITGLDARAARTNALT